MEQLRIVQFRSGSRGLALDVDSWRRLIEPRKTASVPPTADIGKILGLTVKSERGKSVKAKYTSWE